MTERIVSRLKDRSRYKLNEHVYVPNAIRIEGRKDLSFFEYALEGIEKYHETLGRFNFPDQTPLVIDPSKALYVKREVPPSLISKVEIDLKTDIINFYLSSLKEFCIKGDDKSTYGETVYCDADLILLLNERINLGRYVAESKLQSKSSIRDVIEEKDKLMKELRDYQREEDVIRKARKVALIYEIDPNIVEKIFRWIIDKTIKVEVEYLQKKFG
jgi:chorismate mutase